MDDDRDFRLASTASHRSHQSRISFVPMKRFADFHEEIIHVSIETSLAERDHVMLAVMFDLPADLHGTLAPMRITDYHNELSDIAYLVAAYSPTKDADDYHPVYSVKQVAHMKFSWVQSLG